MVTEIFNESRNNYGSPIIHQELERHGEVVSENTVPVFGTRAWARSIGDGYNVAWTIAKFAIALWALFETVHAAVT